MPRVSLGAAAGVTLAVRGSAVAEERIMIPHPVLLALPLASRWVVAAGQVDRWPLRHTRPIYCMMNSRQHFRNAQHSLAYTYMYMYLARLNIDASPGSASGPGSRTASAGV